MKNAQWDAGEDSWFCFVQYFQHLACSVVIHNSSEDKRQDGWSASSLAHYLLETTVLFHPKTSVQCWSSVISPYSFATPPSSWVTFHPLDQVPGPDLNMFLQEEQAKNNLCCEGPLKPTGSHPNRSVMQSTLKWSKLVYRWRSIINKKNKQ